MLKELQTLQERASAVDEERARSLDEALEEHLQERESVLTRRFELVSGREEPDDSELASFNGPRTCGESRGAGKGLPCFWLNVLLSHVRCRMAIVMLLHACM